MALPTVVDTLEHPSGRDPDGVAELRVWTGGDIGWTGNNAATFGALVVPYVAGVARFENVRPNTGSSGDQIDTPSLYRLIRRVRGQRDSVEWLDVPDLPDTFDAGDMVAEFHITEDGLYMATDDGRLIPVDG